MKKRTSRVRGGRASSTLHKQKRGETRSFDSLRKASKPTPAENALTNIAHELRSSLTFLKGYLDLLREGALGEVPPSARDDVDAVATKTDSVVRRLNDLLMLEDAGTIKLSDINLAQIAHESVRSARAVARGAGIDLREEIEPVPLIQGNAAHLEQLFENLLDNAIKYSPNGGQICVRVRNLKRWVQVQVQDHGIGIPRASHENIFQRFYRVDNPTTRKYRNAGLGLTIVRQIVQAHRGRVWVESEEGQGSTFYFTLPKKSRTERLRKTL